MEKLSKEQIEQFLNIQTETISSVSGGYIGNFPEDTDETISSMTFTSTSTTV